jgi:hypothetical protein
MQIPVRVAISGGVTPRNITAPSVGVLLRLSLACALGLSLQSVTITSVFVNFSDTLTAVSSNLILLPTSPVNIATGICAALMSPSRRLSEREMLALTDAPATVVLLQVKLIAALSRFLGLLVLHFRFISSSLQYLRTFFCLHHHFRRS